VTPIAREDGVAMLVAVMAVLLLTALGAALILSSSAETIIAASFRSGIEARYAAAAMLDRGMDDLTSVEDWSLVTGGVLRSSWVDGAPTGPRRLGDGSTIDLMQLVNVANCQKSTACSLAELFAVTDDRPWGANNPQWQLYAYGPMRNMLAPGIIDSPYYVVLLAGNGPSAGLLAVRAEAFGPRGAHAVVEATAARIGVSGDEWDYNDHSGDDGVKVFSWREVR
jgi:hypothetical protein